METPTPRRANRLGMFVTAVALGVGMLGVLAPAAFAQENEDEAPAGGRPHALTDEQRACLEQQGVQKPEPDENGERVRPTEEQREAFRAAAEACGIELPRKHRPRLTDEQRACLEEQGAQKPERDENGEPVPLTEEQREAARAAFEACGIEVPLRLSITEEQRTCLEEQGVEKPQRDENGRRVRPTEEQREAFRAAAEACGIDLPDRPQSDNDEANSEAS
jgi:hypothetical protein